MEYYLNVWRNYFNFSGRARRSEYWMFILVNIVVSIGLVAVDFAIRIIFNLDYFFLFYPLYLLAILVPSLAVQVRRLHDAGFSGWMILLGLIPFFGGIILLIFYLLDSETGVNKYGPNPKHSVA